MAAVIWRGIPFGLSVGIFAQASRSLAMDDQQLLDSINELVEEEERLLHAHEGDGLSSDEHARLEEVRVQLDRCWDLLRQRRSREQYDLDPDEASVRDADTVEGYEQ
jgi:Protein of unknown function (DUF2630)